MKVRIELRTGKTFIIEMGGNSYLAPHFQLKELANISGNQTQVVYVINRDTETMVQVLEDYRAHIGNKSVIVNSNFRQTNFNKAVGGISTSLHLKGMACDVKCANLTDKVWKDLQTFFIAEGKKYGYVIELLRYDGFFHIGLGITYQKTNYIADKR